MLLRPWLALPGALAIFLKRPHQAVRAYALVQILSCAYYGLYENSASEFEYRVGYTLFTVIATTLAGWQVVRLYASRTSRIIGLVCGIASLFVMARFLPLADLGTRLVLVQAAGAAAIAIALGCALPWEANKLIPATLGALFAGLALFWYGISLKPEWQEHWDWIAPVWMHTAAYSWLGWKLPWGERPSYVAPR